MTAEKQRGGGVSVGGSDPIALLLSTQNPDGGWGYKGGSSWTEPTCFALLALAAAGPTPPARERGVRWLLRTARSDGGWAPHPSVDQSTWVTALALLALTELDAGARLGPAVAWLENQTGEESRLLARLRRLLLGERLAVGEGTMGWSWFPGTAAWVMPTAVGILALEKIGRRQPREALEQRIQMGRDFLLARTCADGGWNHGSSRALGYEANSYPETTGIALVALHGSRSSRIPTALAKAENELPRCRSAQGQSWLRMGLLAHGRKPSPAAELIVERHSVLDAAALVLAAAAETDTGLLWRTA